MGACKTNTMSHSGRPIKECSPPTDTLVMRGVTSRGHGALVDEDGSSSSVCQYSPTAPLKRIRRYFANLFRPWKVVTFAGGTGFFVWGAYYWRLMTWDVGVSLLMSVLCYALAPLGVTLGLQAFEGGGVTVASAHRFVGHNLRCWLGIL
jgi:hypothetical protein